MTSVSYSSKDFETFIGIDVDKKSYVFTVGDHYTLSRAKKIPAKPKHLYNFIQNNLTDKKVICAYEAGPTGFDLYDYLTQKKIPCLVIPPTSIPKAPNEKVKNNNIDSIKITEELRAAKAKSIECNQNGTNVFFVNLIS